jgi:hypothetical protein
MNNDEVNFLSPPDVLEDKVDPEKGLKNLQRSLINSLQRRIDSGEASAAEFDQARKLLADNKITAIPAKQNNLHSLGVRMREHG